MVRQALLVVTTLSACSTYTTGPGTTVAPGFPVELSIDEQSVFSANRVTVLLHETVPVTECTPTYQTNLYGHGGFGANFYGSQPLFREGEQSTADTWSIVWLVEAGQDTGSEGVWARLDGGAVMGSFADGVATVSVTGGAVCDGYGNACQEIGGAVLQVHEVDELERGSCFETREVDDEGRCVPSQSQVPCSWE